MTGQTSDDKDRDVISVSTLARIRRSELDALESEVLTALEKALEATKPADNAPQLAPLQPEQPQFNDWEAHRRGPDILPSDDLPFDHVRTDPTGAETPVAHLMEPAQVPSSNIEPLMAGWASPDRATNVRMPPAPVQLGRRQDERWSRDPLEIEKRGSDSAPFARLHEGRETGCEQSPGSNEQARREDFIEFLRQRQRSAVLDVMQQPKMGRRSALAILGRLTLAITIAGAAAFSVFQFMSAKLQTEGSSIGTPANATLWTRFLGAPQHDQPAIQPAARLVLTALSGPANRPIALGVNVEGGPAGAFVLIRGLPSGGRIAAGVATGEGIWRVSLRDLSRAAVVAPTGYVGTMSLAIDLSRADGTVIDSDVLQLEWTPAMADTVAPTPVKTTTIVPTHSPFPPPPALIAVPQGAPAASESAKIEGADSDADGQVSRQLDPEEVGKLLQRAETYLQNGDIAAARLLFRRAAEGGDMQATLAMAATYDPAILRQLGALGASPDVAKARAWYQKASELGSAEARLRLQRLTQDIP
jgi:hypothetical protein